MYEKISRNTDAGAADGARLCRSGRAETVFMGACRRGGAE